MTDYKITIGITTTNRPEPFQNLISSIVNSFNMATKNVVVEFIIVCNYDSQIYVDKVIDKSRLNDIGDVKIFQGNGKISYGRNKIIEKSASSYICFIDDDCILAEDYIEVLYSKLFLISDKSIGIVPKVIRIVDLNDQLDRAVIDSGFDHYFSYHGNKGLAERFNRVRWGPTANIIIGKKHCMKFKELPNINVGGEDVIWGFESSSNGKYFSTEPKLIVYHQSNNSNHTSIDKFCDKAFEYGKAESYMCNYFPKVTSTKYKFEQIITSIYQILLYKIRLKQATEYKQISKIIKAHYVLGNIYYSLRHTHRYPRIISLSYISQIKINGQSSNY